MQRHATPLLTCLLIALLGTPVARAAEKPLDLASGWGLPEMAAVAELWAQAPRPRLVAPRTNAPPTIDGRADEDAWKSATVVDWFVANNGTFPKPPQRFGIDPMIGDTTVRLLYDEKFLYLHFRCGEEHIGWLQKGQEKRDGSVWKDDCVEVFLDPARSYKSAYHLIVNPVPALYDAREKAGERGDRSWNLEGEKVASHVGDDFWAVEMAIPFASLGGAPRPGDVWALNLCRQRIAASQKAIRAFGTWTGNPEGFQHPEMMGDLVFGGGAMQVTPPTEEPFFGISELRFRYRNPGAKPLKLRAHVVVAGLDGTEESDPVALIVPPGQEAAATVPFRVTREGMAQATLVVTPAESGAPLLVQRRGLSILPITPIIDGVLPRMEKLQEKAESPDFKASIVAYLEELRGLRQRVQEFKAALAAKPSDFSNYRKWLALHREAQNFAGQASFVVWTKSPWLATGPNDFPAVMEDVKELKLKLAQNEWEHAAIMLSNLTEEPLNIIVRGDLPGLQAVMAPLATDSDIIVQQNPRALNYETVRGFNLPGKTGEPMVRLGQFRELVLMPLTSRQLFLTFHSAELKPGAHRGRLALHTLNRALGVKHLAVTLDVLPFRLPDDPELGVHVYDYSGKDYQLKDIRAHKVTHLFTADRGKFQLRDGKFTHDVTRAAQGTRKKLRFGGKAAWAYGLCLAYHKWAAGEGITPADKRYDAYWRQAVGQFVEAHREAGFEDGSYSVGAWDEVKGKDVDTCVHLLKLLKEEAPHLRVANTIQCSMPEQKKQFPYVDIWVAAGGYYWNEKWRDELEKAGKELWAYTCKTPVRGQDPVGYYRFAGWRAMRARMDGIAVFAWSYLVYDLDGELLATRGWEAWRQGIEDWQYWNRLEKEIARLRAAGKTAAADAARARLDELLDKLFKAGPHPRDSVATDTEIAAARAVMATEILRLQRIK